MLAENVNHASGRVTKKEFGLQSEESLLSLRCHRITMVQPAESR
jgi:hypothetical protein